MLKLIEIQDERNCVCQSLVRGVRGRNDVYDCVGNLTSQVPIIELIDSTGDSMTIMYIIYD